VSATRPSVRRSAFVSDSPVFPGSRAHDGRLDAVRPGGRIVGPRWRLPLPVGHDSFIRPAQLISPSAKLARWDRTEQLSSIEVPALVIGARYDTMDPAYLAMMADRLPAGRYLHCPNGSHLAMYDDQQAYFGGLIAFLHDLAGG